MPKQPPHKTKKISTMQRVWLIVGAALLVIFIAAFMLRGWIRGTLGVTYAYNSHAHVVDKHFEESLNQLKPLLQENHAPMGDAPAPTSCKVYAYEGIRATYTCERSTSSTLFEAFNLTVSSRERWERRSADFNEQLREKYWYQSYYDQTRLGGLLDLKPDQKQANYVHYEKSDKDTTCTLTMRYAYSQVQNQHQLGSQLRCDKRVKFFGGYMFKH